MKKIGFIIAMLSFTVILFGDNTDSVEAKWVRTTKIVTDISRFSSVEVDNNGFIYAAGTIRGTVPYEFSPEVSVNGTFQYENAVLVKYGPKGKVWWAKTVSEGKSNSVFKSIAIDKNNNIYAAGYFCNNEKFVFGDYTVQGKTPYNLVLVKYNSEGVVQWAKTVVEGPERSNYKSVAVSNQGNIYAVGSIDAGNFDFGNNVVLKSDKTSAFIVKYNSEGIPQWAKIVKTVKSVMKTSYVAVGVDASENVYASGGFEEKSDFGDGVKGKDGYLIVKYSSDGKAKGIKLVGDYSIQINSLALDKDGNIYGAGSSASKKKYDFGNNVKLETDPNGSGRIFVIKYDSKMNAQWAKTVYGGTNPSGFFSVKLDDNGNAYAAGYIVGMGVQKIDNGRETYTFDKNFIFKVYETCGLLVKYNSKGETQWVKITEGTDGYAPSITFEGNAVDKEGNIYAAGFVYPGCSYNLGNGVKLDVPKSDKFNKPIGVILVHYKEK